MTEGRCIEDRCMDALKEMWASLLVVGVTDEEKKRYSEALTVSIRLLEDSKKATMNHKINPNWGDGKGK